jgi:hypothetical protein
MAKQSKSQDITQTSTNTFVKGLNKDSDPSFVSDGMWTHARNTVNNTAEGDMGTLSNESANYLCATAGETIINGKKVIVGAIHLYSDKWVIYTAVHITGQIESINSEIGLFEEDLCRYRPIVQDPCLKLNELNLITGASREKEDCSWAVYFADGLNPDRYLNIGDPQTWPSNNYQWIGNNTYADSNGNTLQWPGVDWNEECNTINDCITCNKLTTLNCDELRLARLMQTPCLKLKFGKAGGTLFNGSYSACIAYSINGEKVTDWFSPSNIQPIYFESEPQGALELEIEADSENFDEFILCIIQYVNQQTVARRIGIYSTKTDSIYIDQIKTTLETVPVETLPILTPVFEKSDQMIETNNYLLRVGPTSKFDFNYQPLANLIKTEWVSVEYPEDYYIKGESNTSYLRDEVYSFFIRWVYNTGDKSSSYHIPGRAPRNFQGQLETIPYNDLNTLFATPQDQEKLFEVINTASINSLTQSTLPDGGIVLASGDMGYWESTEIYPDNRPDIWNSTFHCWTGTTNTDNDLCGKPIRHHKFPESFIYDSQTDVTCHFSSGGNVFTLGADNTIRLMGVQFNNIIYPKDNEGNDIPGIVGYEILRGSRENNRTIVAKGMINNLRTYQIVGQAATNNTVGLYPNYPFNTIQPEQYPGTFTDPYIQTIDEDNGNILYNYQKVPRDVMTFHSPDTSFKNPYLSATELKLYGSLRGNSVQKFINPNQHPEHKLLSNAVAIVAFVGGAIEAIISLIGKRTFNSPEIEAAIQNIPAGAATGNAAQSAAIAGLSVPITTYNTFLGNYYGGFLPLADAALSLVGGYGATSYATAQDTLIQAISSTTSVHGLGPILPAGSIEAPDFAYAPGFLRAIGGLNYIQYYFAQGSDTVFRLFYASLPYRQYALQMIAEGFYSKMNFAPSSDGKRFRIDDSFYLRNNIQRVPRYFENNTVNNYLAYSINNINRSETVFLRTKNGAGLTTGPSYITGAEADKSLVTLQNPYLNNLGPTFKNPQVDFSKKIASHYGGLKFRIRNQYGQLEAIKQIVITSCEQKFDYDALPESIVGGTLACPKQYKLKKINSTPVIFGGDTYICRYTEKNSMLFFWEYLFGQNFGFEYDYLQRQNIPQPRFWMNSQKYDFNGALAEIVDLNNLGTPSQGVLPQSYYNLDYENYNYANDSVPLFAGYPGLFGVKESFFYLAVSGARDFFVESEVLVNFRSEGITDGEKYYNPYGFGDLTTLFNIDPAIITRGNFYRYDYSLSASKFYTEYFSRGNLQTRYYDPKISSLCYTYFPDRIIYSFPAADPTGRPIDSAFDGWFVYLANNYREFKDQISAVKNFAKTGILVTFHNSSPLVFQGIDQLQTEAGTKVTIGDGGLFAQTPQNIVVSDKSYEYGSCQNNRSIISTPAGTYFISQNQGKIFSFAGSLKEISQNGMKWWFTLFLPYKLTEDFPDYPHTDNPVAGIGCQAIYDNRNSIVYFTKKDYKLKPQYKGRVIYDAATNDFVIDKIARFKLSDPDNPLFESASWTMSYDPKSEFWISFHDWHPDLLMAGKETFLSTKFNTIWKHNDICDRFCNYYGVNYPFEVEFPISMGQTVTTMKSMEYILEAYRRNRGNCVDQFHVLDYNFDQAVVYNTEQVSGYLNLNLYPKNNVALSLQYPQVNINSIDILFSKEEQKYRFNQFWDITRDRGEFPIGSNYPPTGPVIPGTTILNGPTDQNNIWVTEANGYIKQLNPTNLNYSKPELQRKKFRHYLNFLFLSKQVSVDTNIILKIVNSKKTYSPR